MVGGRKSGADYDQEERDRMKKERKAEKSRKRERRKTAHNIKQNKMWRGMMAFLSPVVGGLRHNASRSDVDTQFVDDEILHSLLKDDCVEIARRGAGNFVGEQSLLTSHRRMASVIALTLVQTHVTTV